MFFWSKLQIFKLKLTKETLLFLIQVAKSAVEFQVAKSAVEFQVIFMLIPIKTLKSYENIVFFYSMASKPINIRRIRIAVLSHIEELCQTSYYIQFSTNTLK